MILFRLLAITDRRLDLTEPTSEIPALALLFRDKGLPQSKRLHRARELREWTRSRSLPLLVHGSESIARDIGADGLHLPAHISPQAIEGLIVGCSCHDRAELDRAAAAGIDYVTLSPVLRSPQKGSPLGWERFEELARACPLPVFALGGLGPDDLERAQTRGAWGVAGIRSFASASTSRS